MDYVITFSDVMAGVITLGLGVITFFIKGWFNNLKSSTEEIKKQIRENDEKVNKRIGGGDRPGYSKHQTGTQ